MLTTTEQRVQQLDERCDRCDGKARYRAMLGQGELLFCYQHGQYWLVPLGRDALYVEAMP